VDGDSVCLSFLHSLFYLNLLRMVLLLLQEGMEVDDKVIIIATSAKAGSTIVESGLSAKPMLVCAPFYFIYVHV